MKHQWKKLLFAILLLGTIGFVISDAAHATIQQTDIVSFWPLDEEAGAPPPASYADVVNGLDGSPNALPTPEPQGKINGAQSFDGIDNGILVLDDNAFDFGGDQSFSIEYWSSVAGSTTFTGPKVVIGRFEVATGHQWWMGITADGFARFYLDDGSGAVGVRSDISIAGGVFHHIVGVRDAINDQVLLYVDGILADSAPDSALAGGFDLAADVTIGYMDNQYYFPGVIDEVTIYNRALAANEVLANFNQQDGPRYVVDTDGDGINDGIENDGPNGGDANLDGTLDMNQSEVAALPTLAGTDYVAIETSAGTLANCQAVANPSPDDAPSGESFPWDFFEFTITGLNQGDPATVTMTFPAGTSLDTYYKYGPNPTPADLVSWYEFLDDGTTGAQVNDNVVTLLFVDGERGDDTGPDGQIVDQGGPAVTASATTSGGGGGGGGGGCFIATANYGSYTETPLALLASLTLFVLLASLCIKRMRI